MRKWIVGLAALAILAAATFLVAGFAAGGVATPKGSDAGQVRAASVRSRPVTPSDPLVPRDSVVPSDSVVPPDSVAPPAPVVAPAPVDPTRVLMIGDSLAFGIADHMQAAMDSYGDQAQFVSDAYPGASLFFGHVNGVGPVDEIAGYLDAHPDTDVVIASFGGICWQQILPFECGSTVATANWVATQTQVVDEVRARGIKVLWAVTPTVSPDASDYLGWPEIQQATIKNMTALGVPLIRWDQYLSRRGDGAETPEMPLSLPGGESALYDVHKADGAHITSIADAFLAEQTARDWWKWA